MSVGASRSYPVIFSDSPQYSCSSRQGVACFLPTLGGESHAAIAINGHGDVVGYSDAPDGTRHAVLWRRGVLVDLGTGGGTRAVAMDVNVKGVVVGWIEYDPTDHRAFVWQNGHMKLLALPESYTESYATAINDRGQIVGQILGDHTGIWGALWEGGKAVVLGHFSPYDINYSGQVVGDDGSHAILWHRGQASALADLPGTTRSTASAINDRGQIVGYARVGGSRPVLWQNGVPIDLGTLGGPEGKAEGINNRGQIVGTSTDARLDSWPTLWSP